MGCGALSCRRITPWLTRRPAHSESAKKRVTLGLPGKTNSPSGPPRRTATYVLILRTCQVRRPWILKPSVVYSQQHRKLQHALRLAYWDLKFLSALVWRKWYCVTSNKYRIFNTTVRTSNLARCTSISHVPESYQPEDIYTHVTDLKLIHMWQDCSEWRHGVFRRPVWQMRQ